MTDSKTLSRSLWRQVASLAPKARLDALLDSSNARLAVQSVPAFDLYATVVEVGLADATDIVQLASLEQFRSFVDLGAWKRDRLDPHQVLTFIRAARGDEPSAFLKKVHGLDSEVLQHMLRRFLVVHDLEETPDVNPGGVTLETPEGKYLVEFRAEGAELAALRSLLNDLIAENPFEAVRKLEALRWEMSSELEETALRFRTARLEDLGFPDPVVAASLFAYRKPPPPPQGAETVSALARAERPDFVGQALRALEPVEQENLAAELRAVINAAMVAEAVDPGDLDGARAVGERVRDALTLGLEHLTCGDVSRAADVFREHPVRAVFQVGFSLTLELKFRADRLAKEPLARLGSVYLLWPEEAEAVRVLRGPRPLRALKVEGAEPVPFRSRHELEQSRQLLARAEQQLPVFVALLGGHESEARARLGCFRGGLEALGMDRLLATAVAHAVVEGVPKVAPFREAALSALGEALFEGTAEAPRLRSKARERAFCVLQPLVPETSRQELERLLDLTLERFRRELGAAYLQDKTLGPETDVLLPLQ